MSVIDIWAIIFSALSMVIGAAVVTLGIGYIKPWERDNLASTQAISTTWVGLFLGAALIAAMVLILETNLVQIPVKSTVVLRQLLQEYGYLAFFIIFVIEGTMLLYFAPSESLVPVAIILMADSTYDYAIIIGLAITGATLGQTALFLIAKYAGKEYLLETRWFTTNEEIIDQFGEWFSQKGPIVIPISNSLLFTRGLLTVPAGLSDMRTSKFAILSAIGTLSFETILAAVTVGILEVI